MQDEEYLLEVTKDESDHIGEKVTFKFDTDNVHYEHSGSPESGDEIHTVGDNILIPETRTTWSERLYYGLGNSALA